jgi:hypothetical protein
MLRDATHGPLIKRTIMLHLDHEGVLHLEEEFLAGLLEGDALGIPGPRPTCESCWAESAMAIVLCPGEVARLRGTACVTQGRQGGAQLVPILSY